MYFLPWPRIFFNELLRTKTHTVVLLMGDCYRGPGQLFVMCSNDVSCHNGPFERESLLPFPQRQGRLWYGSDLAHLYSNVRDSSVLYVYRAECTYYWIRIAFRWLASFRILMRTRPVTVATQICPQRQTSRHRYFIDFDHQSKTCNVFEPPE